MSESLTVDQAVELMEAPPVADASAPEPQVEQAEDTQVSPDTTGEGVGEAEQPGDDATEAEEVSTEEQTEEVEAEPVPPPQWWDAEAKARFSELPPEVQATVLEQENKREAITAKVKQEAAEARKQAEAQIQGFNALAERITEALPLAEKAFQSKWEGATPQFWSELSAQDPQAAFQLRMQFDAEMAELQSVRAAEQQAQAVAHQAHLQQLAQDLQTKAPELLSNPESLRALEAYGNSNGIPQTVIMTATADELLILNKARLWDESQAKAKSAAEAPRTVPKTPPVKVVAPVAASSQGNAHQREIQRLENRLAQTKSLDDAVALMEARRAAPR